ncbi:DNA circularization protein [Morganella morganii]|uniref:DNA circularization protein n=1 Tax=Morganella morganii TaxID=582 RepID=UPI0032D9BCA4
MDFEQVMSLFNDTSWRSRVNPGKGTFRGVPFYIIDDATVTGGRRVVRHEYPLRDDGETEDMGLSTREYAITAVVFGDDYLDKKEDLIAAMEEAGPGEMDHPYYSKQQVQIETWTVRESCYTGGIAVFSVTFIPAADNTSPVVSSEAELDGSALTDSTLADITANWEKFTDNVSYLTERLNAAESTINTIVNGIRSLPAGSGMNALLGAALGLKGSLKMLVNAPADLFGSVSDLIGGMADVAVPAAANRALRKTSAGIASQFPSNIPAVAEFQNVMNTTTQVFISRELATLTLDAAVASGREQQTAPALTQVTRQRDLTPLLPGSGSPADDAAIPLIETVGDVRQSSSDLDGGLTQLIVDTGDFGWFRTSEQLRDFRIIFLQLMQTTAEILPAAMTIRVNDTEPALVLLYRETGTTTQIDRFIRRNGVRHPAFVTGALDVEVIND